MPQRIPKSTTFLQKQLKWILLCAKIVYRLFCYLLPFKWLAIENGVKIQNKQRKQKAGLKTCGNIILFFRVKYFQYKIYLGNNLQYSLVLKCDTILKNRAPVSIFQTHSLWRHRIWIVELKCINAQIKALCHLKGIPLVPKLGKQKELPT